MVRTVHFRNRHGYEGIRCLTPCRPPATGSPAPYPHSTRAYCAAQTAKSTAPCSPPSLTPSLCAAYSRTLVCPPKPPHSNPTPAARAGPAETAPLEFLPTRAHIDHHVPIVGQHIRRPDPKGSPGSLNGMLESTPDSTLRISFLAVAACSESFQLFTVRITCGSSKGDLTASNWAAAQNSPTHQSQSIRPPPKHATGRPVERRETPQFPDPPASLF